MEDELTALRARAYGRDADIAMDAAAQRRLAELEAVQRAASHASGSRPTDEPPSPAHDAWAPDILPKPADPAPPVGESSSADVVDSAQVAQAGAATDAGEPTSQTTSAAGEPPSPEESAGARPRRIPTRLMLLWAASLVVVAVLGAAVGGWITGNSAALKTTSPTARQIDVLPLDRIDVPVGLPIGAGPSATGVIYHGMYIVLFEDSGYSGEEACLQGYMPPKGMDFEDDASSEEYPGGFYFGGCELASFAARFELLVEPDMPQEFQDHFTLNTALQFVLDGDRVVVFEDASASDPDPTDVVD